MKNRITISKSNDMITFYLNSKGRSFYLFTQKFSKAVYEFFTPGRSENEIRNYKSWDKNPRLDKTITKIPVYIKYISKYEI